MLRIFIQCTIIYIQKKKKKVTELPLTWCIKHKFTAHAANLDQIAKTH